MEFAKRSVMAIRALGEAEKIFLGALLVGMWFMTDLGLLDAYRGRDDRSRRRETIVLH